MKKFIYILVLVAVILSCVVVPFSASAIEYNHGSHLILDEDVDGLDLVRVELIHDYYLANPIQSEGVSVYITPLVKQGLINMHGMLNGVDENGCYDISNFKFIKSKSFTFNGYTYDLSPSTYDLSLNTYFRWEVRDLDGNLAPFICTYIFGDSKAAYTYMSIQDPYMINLAKSYLCLLENPYITIPTLNSIFCNERIKLTLNAGDKCVINFMETLDSPKFKITNGGAWVGGLTAAVDMRGGCSYTFVAETSGDYYFDFYDTVTNMSGKFTIYRTLSDQQDANYMQGFFDGLQHNYAAGYTDGYNAGFDDGFLDGFSQGSATSEERLENAYNEGYTQGSLDNANSGYDEGYSAGYSAGHDAGSFEAYNKGYNAGYNQALQDNPDDGSYRDGYDEGYAQGALDNANSGYQDGYTAGYNQALQDNPDDGSYNDGYNAGYNQALKDNPGDGNFNEGVAAGEANVLNDIRAYLRAQGIEPVGNTASELMMLYADSISSSNENWDSGSYQNAFNAGYEYAGSYYIPLLEEKFDEGKEYTMDLILGYLDRKEIDIPAETPHAVSMYLDLVYNANGGTGACSTDHEALYNLGLEQGKVLGRAEGFDSSFITKGTDSIVKGASTTFLEIVNVEILGYKLSAILVGIIVVMFVLVVGKIVASIL